MDIRVFASPSMLGVGILESGLQQPTSPYPMSSAMMNPMLGFPIPDMPFS